MWKRYDAIMGEDTGNYGGGKIGTLFALGTLSMIQSVICVMLGHG